MINLENNYTAIYFLGIGGIGMSALARYCQNNGYRVAGYDRTQSTLTSELDTEGICVIYQDTVDAIPDEFKNPDQTLVVRTPAVPETNAQRLFFEQNGYKIVKRAELLGFVTRHMKSLCVAGTHGKTTTSTILAHLMYQSEIGTNAFLGGISNNYGSNLLITEGSNYVTIEADEFDRSFHQLSPYMAVITSVDPDHLDIYGTPEAYQESFKVFTSLIQKSGVLLLKKELDFEPRLQPGVKLYSYSASEKADFYADNIVVRGGNIYFDFHTPGETIAEMKLGVPVWINIENSVAAMAVAWLNGVNANELRLGLASYSGIYRRFNIKVNSEKVALVDDYAHHPTELRTSIYSIRKLYPERLLIGVFQPHLYSRTRDFAQGFAEALSMLDEVILLPIYPARELPIPEVCSEMLLDKITCDKKSICQKTELVNTIAEKVKTASKPVAVITLGAGDIDRIVPLLAKALD